MKWKLFFVVIFTFLSTFIFSKNTFAQTGNVYISRVYATDGKEFVEIFNSSEEDLEFSKISLKRTKAQTEFAKLENGIFKAQSYILFSQNIEDSDALFLDEYRQTDAVNQQPIVGLYIDEAMASFLCADEKRCEGEFQKNSTDLKPSSKGVEKLAVSIKELLKNNEKITAIEERNKYHFGLRDLNNYIPQKGGFAQKIPENNTPPEEEKPRDDKVENAKEDADITLKNKEETQKDGVENAAEVEENKTSTINIAEKVDKKISVAQKAEEIITIEKTQQNSSENQEIIAPNTGFKKDEFNILLFEFFLIFFNFSYFFERYKNETI